MKVLVACEESQVVCKAFRERGHTAYSCDILPCSGGHPEWHIKNKVEHILWNDHFLTEDNNLNWNPSGWDLMIAHPPCTYLSNSGVCHLYNTDGTRNESRWKLMREAAEFFKYLLYSQIPRIVIENPIQHKYAREAIGVGPGQIIQPWMFGHPEQKATCLWLKNIPALKETNNIYNEMKALPDNKRQRLHYLPPSKDRQRIRSTTFKGIADALAEQYGVMP
jgi:hypothetical protein